MNNKQAPYAEFWATCGRCDREVDFLLKVTGVHANISQYCLAVICQECWPAFEQEKLLETFENGEPKWCDEGDGTIANEEGFFRRVNLLQKENKMSEMANEHGDNVYDELTSEEQNRSCQESDSERRDWNEKHSYDPGDKVEREATTGLMPIEAKQEIMTALAVTPEKDEFGVMDSYDEMQIVSDIHQSISEDILKAWVYETRGGGKEITYNAVRHWSNVRTQQGFPIAVEEATQVDHSDKIDGIIKAQQAGIYSEKEAKEMLSFYFDNIFIQVKSVDVVTKQARLGFAEQPIKDRNKEDPFAFRKACGKAQRNALKEFMTAEEKAAIIYMAETQGRKTIKLKKPLNQANGITKDQKREIEKLADKERIAKYLNAKGYFTLDDVSFQEAKGILATLKGGE